MQIKANLCEIPIFHRDLFEKGLKRAQKGRFYLCPSSKRTFGIIFTRAQIEPSLLCPYKIISVITAM